MIRSGFPTTLKMLRAQECFQVATSSLRCRPSVGYNVLVTCEHGGSELPPGRPWHAQDLRLKGTHWAGDLGAGDFSREIAARLRVPALIHDFSRLIIDVNRPLDDPTLFRATAEGVPIELNQSITVAERQKRIERYYRPYHDELNFLTHILNPPLLLSVHSFTNNYEGKRRDIDLGILFNRHESLALEFEAYFRSAGYQVRLNEPWSGKEGFMYALSQVETDENRGIMLEFRQDLLLQPQWREKMLDHLENFLTIQLNYLSHTDSVHSPIKKGEKVPSFTFATMLNGTPTKITTKNLFDKKTVVLFGLPGAFTPGCTKEHLPSFVREFEKFKEKGVDTIACTSVNDPYVLDAWAKENNASDKVLMLADGNGEFARMLGLIQNTYKAGLATRSKRYAMIVKNGVVDWIGIDDKGVNLSKGENVLDQLD